MNQYSIIFLGLVATAFGAIFIPCVWNMSAVSKAELDYIRSEFSTVKRYLQPLIVTVNTWQRSLFRIAAFLYINALAYPLIYHSSHWKRALVAFTLLLTIEWGIIVWVTARNVRVYRRDLAECRLFTHPDTRSIVGCIRDRAEPPYEGNHFVHGGRIITIVSSEQQTRLFIPFVFYGQRPVEETEISVAVFYHSWPASGFQRGKEHQLTAGVYVGFRFVPNFLEQLSGADDSALPIVERPPRG